MRFFLLLLLFPFALVAQHQTRYDLHLAAALQHPTAAQKNRQYDLLVQGEPSAIRALVAQCGGQFKFNSGDVCAVRIPFASLQKLERSPAVLRIENTFARGSSLMDTARIRNNIDSAQQGAAPLTQSYTGKNVIVGIVDGGIYFRHADFRKANGDTRIRNIWDQALTGGPAPQPFNYGSEWDSAAINAGNCGHSEPLSDNGHGTNVAGIATGNGLSVATHPFLHGRYTGVAPDANIIVVRIDNSSNDFLGRIADAVNYIFQKADALGMPCVVNTSIGTYYGSRDGKDLGTQAIENMLEAKRGRALVAAAGNGGAIKYHLSYNLSPTDSQFTWFTYNSATAEVYFDLWADTSNFKLANFAIGCDNNTPAFLGRTRYYNVISNFNPAQGSGVQIDDSLFNGSTKLGTYSILASLSGNTYHIEFLIHPVVTTHLWRLQTLGTGRFDAWASKSLINTSSMPTALPGGFSSPQYRFGDSLETIVSSWQCSNKVITVANYSNRAGYLDKDSNYVNLTISPYFEVVGDKFSTSSMGPTRDGRMKPDIAATGSTTTATGDSLYIATLIANAQGFKVSYGGLHTRNGGTSMASPVVTGAVALLFQKNPMASYNDVKNAIIHTAKIDTFTTANVPNYKFGYGKLNAFRALLTPMIFGCMDTASLNYNPQATIDTGGCIPKIYGCMDTASINFNASANVSNGSCISKVYGCTDTASINFNVAANVNNGSCITKVYGCMDTASINYNASANVSNGSCIAKVYGCTDSSAANFNPQANVNNGTCHYLGILDNKEAIQFSVSPNPFNEKFSLRADCESCTDLKAVVYDVTGKHVEEIELKNHLTSFSTVTLSSGSYTLILFERGRFISVKRITAE
ncbi:MAG: S8 family serine peptidase [Chitinophagales bacterium]